MGVQRDQHCGAHIHVIRKNGLRIQEVRWGAPICCFELAIAMSVCFQNCEGMKIAPLGLAGGRSYDRTNSLRTPTMKESQLLREKNHFLGLCFNMFKRCACPVSLTCAYTRNTRPCDVVCLQSKHFRSVAGMIAPPAKIYARDRSRSRWNMKHFRQTARGCLLHQ